MRAVALDLGSKTIGLARSDASGMVASSWQVLARRGTQLDLQSLTTLLKEVAATTVVVGLPLELDGSVGHRGRIVQRFTKALREALDPGIEIVTWDERFSTRAAERSMLDGNLSRKKRKERIDAVAAQFILSSWLEAQRNRAQLSPTGERDPGLDPAPNPEDHER